jgi:hypothetical protein
LNYIHSITSRNLDIYVFDIDLILFSGEAIISGSLSNSNALFLTSRFTKMSNMLLYSAKNCKQHFGLAACQCQMMPQVILHVRMVFLAHVLTQLLMTNNPIPMEQMQKHLRSLHCLCLPDEAPKLVSMQDDGALIPISLEELMKPIRTTIPGILETQVPTIAEVMSAA